MTAALWDRPVPAKSTIDMELFYLWGFDWASKTFLAHHSDGSFTIEDISGVITEKWQVVESELDLPSPRGNMLDREDDMRPGVDFDEPEES